MKSMINRKTAPEVIRLLDYCFKRGVIDASEMEDDYAVKEWYDAMLHSGRYGLLGYDNEDCDWKMWRFFLLRWCRENRLPALGYEYIDNIRRAQGFAFLVIPMTMRFYIMGVKEWLEYPNDINIAVFRQNPREHWSNKVPKHLKKMKTDDFISYIQEFIYEFRKHPMPEMEKLGENAFADFEIAMWQSTRPRRASHVKARSISSSD